MQATENMSISAIRLFTPDTVPETIFIGYSEQTEAGLALGRIVSKGSFKSALVFGYPGTGKSKFAFFLAKRLNEDCKCGFYFAILRCREILDEIILKNIQPEDFRENLRKLSDSLMNKPTILCFDEIDNLNYSITNSLSGEPTVHEISLMILGQWILQFLRKKPACSLVLGVSDYPDLIEPEISKCLEVPIYFEPTDLGIVEEAIRNYLKIDRYKEIASKLVLHLEKYNLTPMSSEIIAASQYIKQKVQKDLNTLPDEEILEIFMTYFCPCSAAKLVKDYTNRYKSLIDDSHDHVIPYWANLKSECSRRTDS